MNLRKISQVLHDKQLRIERIFHLASEASLMEPRDELIEALSENNNQIEKALMLPGLSEIVVDEMWDELTILLTDGDRLGFLVEVATPIPTFLSKTGACQRSWGYYTTHWIYADTIEEIYESAIAWCDTYYDHKKEQAMTDFAT